jgi:hypothetical protein
MTQNAGGPAFDYLLTRDDVIHAKIGIFGLSLGLSRAAHCGQRSALCPVRCDGRQPCGGERQRQRVRNEGENPVPITGTMCCGWRMEDREAFLDYADQITLNGQVEKIRCRS